MWPGTAWAAGCCSLLWPAQPTCSQRRASASSAARRWAGRSSWRWPPPSSPAAAASRCTNRPRTIRARDLLLQLAGSDRSGFLQVKGSERLDAGTNHARFQVRRRTFSLDPKVTYVFAYRPPGGSPGPVWAVPVPDLEARTTAGDAEHLSFEAPLSGADPRWSEYRLRLDELSIHLLTELEAGVPI